MQTIYLKQFGNVLVSRPAGLEAFNAIRPTLQADDDVAINVDDVLTVTPSWFDEFVTNLAHSTQGTVNILPTDNASVVTALPVLAAAHTDKVATVFQRALDGWGKRS